MKCSTPPLDGFSQDALLVRRQILQAACDTLSNPESRGDYNQVLVDDHDAALVTQVPWDKVTYLLNGIFRLVPTLVYLRCCLLT